MGAGHHRERPGKAPAVAVEHRQGPEIDRVLAEVAGDHVAERQQRRAAVVVDHALRVARGAGRVVQADRVPLVLRRHPLVLRVALRQEGLVLGLAQALARPVVLRVVVVDHQGRGVEPGQRRGDRAGEFPVGDQHLRLAVAEAEGDRRRVEAGVEGVEHRPRHRHAVVALDHRGRVGEHHRHGVAAPDPPGGQRSGEAAAAGVELGVGAPQGPVDHRDLVREGAGRPLEIAQRGQRLVVGRNPVEVAVVDAVAAHGPPSGLVARHPGGPRPRHYPGRGADQSAGRGAFSAAAGWPDRAGAGRARSRSPASAPRSGR